ncbi:NAD(P)/FAD-dependent oxidoreductase [Gluconacetobacter tumulisoli]|uniref:FAD-binding oxidoreductase n=1 Tax=Gluconacetobacter tumulisoli TaxID=1286189 RepID=A0A7W4K5C8_9PROT|nr:FAD-binding oxidoreductase [Gluconacetobacter tumulisoli]MBB2200661.1 FAD-binding oxidoreductase [Gluconacetobacter tumulisoli]
MASQQSAPSRYDVAIAGGGIIGVCTALFLRQAGLSVAVFDKGQPGYEQSSRNWGWVRTISQAMEDLPLALASRPLWRQWAGEADFGYRQCGLLSLAQDEVEWTALQAWADAARAAGFAPRRLASAAIPDLMPQSRGRWAGALYSPEDGCAEPDLAMAFLVAKARAAGVAFHADTAVKAIDIQGGQACGFWTETGRVVADSVVVAAGIWSRWLCKTAEIVLPQLKVTASVLRTEPLEGGPIPVVASSRFSVRKRRDGGYTVAQRNSSVTHVTPDAFRFMRQFMPNFLRQKKLLSVRAGLPFFQELREEQRFGKGRTNPFEAYRACDPEPDRKTLAATFERLKADMPVFRTARVAAMWAGVIDVTPDALPVLSSVGTYPGLYLATGFSAHGFGIGPAAGQLMANLITGGRPAPGQEHFTLARFGCNGERTGK